MTELFGEAVQQALRDKRVTEDPKTLPKDRTDVNFVKAVSNEGPVLNDTTCSTRARLLRRARAKGADGEREAKVEEMCQKTGRRSQRGRM